MATKPFSSKRDLTLVTLAAGVNQFGSALSWSGIPFQVVSETGQEDFFSLLFFTAALAAFIAPLFGGYIGDKFSRKAVSVSSALLTGVILLTMYFTTSDNIFLLSSLAFAITFIANLANPALSAWRGAIIDKANEDFEEGIATFNTQVMVAKLLGFAAGPLVYGFLGQTGYLVDSATSLAGGVILVFVSSTLSQKGGMVQTSFIEAFKFLQSQGLNQKNRRILWISGITGLLTFPIISFSLQRLYSQDGTTQLVISLFWLIASGGSVFSNLFLAKGAISRFGRQRVFVIANVAILLAVVGVFFANSWLVVVVVFTLFTLGNPAVGTIIFKEQFFLTESADRSKILGLFDSIDSVGVMLGLILIRQNTLFFITVIIAIVTRIFLYESPFNSKSIKRILLFNKKG